MTIHYQVDFDAPIDIVWSYLNDDQKVRLWMKEVVDITYPQGKNEEDPVGTEFVQKIKEAGRVKSYDGVVTAYHAPNLLSVMIGDDNFQVDVTYNLRATASGTHLDYSCDIDVNSILAKVMGFLFRPLTMRILKRHMTTLKQLVEEEAGR